MQAIVVTVSDKPSVVNKQFLAFIHKSLAGVIKAGYFYKFEIVTAENKSKYEANGVKSLPLVVAGSKRAEGIENCAKLVNKIIDDHKRRISQDGNALMETMQHDEISTVSSKGGRLVIEDEAEDSQNLGQVLKSRADKEMARRQARHEEENKRAGGKVAKLDDYRGRQPSAPAPSGGSSGRKPRQEEPAIHIDDDGDGALLKMFINRTQMTSEDGLDIPAPPNIYDE